MSLKKYATKRLLEIIPVLIGTTILIFLLARLAPGDPARAILGAQASEQAVNRVTENWGLNEPLYVQYFTWLQNALTGDFGTSLAYSVPVSEVILQRSVKTFQLMFVSILISVAIGIPLGIVSALKRESQWDGAIRVLSLVFVSMPRFWTALVFMLLFAFYIPIFPASGLPAFTESPLGFAWHMVLPAMTLGLYYSAYITRMMRSNMLDELGKDYVMTARAMGIKKREVYFKDVAKNSFIPTFTIIGLTVAWILNGSVMVEIVFSISGIGEALVDSVFNRDYPLIQGIILYIAVIFVFINFIVDILYTYFDPRISY